MGYEGSYSQTKFYGADFMSGDERNLFSDWYEGVKDKLFNNREELFAYGMHDVNVQMQVCCVFVIFFEIGQDGPPSENHYNIVYLQQGVQDHVSATRF